MLGAIAGDIIGSLYEAHNIRHTDFPLFPPEADFTDDTVLTVAVAEALLGEQDFRAALRRWYAKYPGRGFGGSFQIWARTPGSESYNSWGNGSAMRVSPVGWVAEDPESALELARASAAVTHNHPEGIKGAQAVALGILLARKSADRHTIRTEIETRFDYRLDHDLNWLREHYSFDVSCQGSVPQAISCFLQGKDFEDTVRKAVSIGGDSDTIAAMAGSLAEAFHGGVPDSILQPTWDRLPTDMREVIAAFQKTFHTPGRVPE